MQHFCNMSDGADIEEQYRVFFQSCNYYILELNLDSLNITEAERLMKISEDK